ncbi:MAG: hypothetical protein OXT65_09485 [Alphaproteobacteria bacterium]|nr:hypothetical protein [Alphaproteobacteria bacterium]
MFDITAEDIALLSDKDTRALVVLLCESEMRRRGLPVSAVTGGGDQDAADGGIDARVALPDQTEIDGFIPRSATGFQVKKPNMARTEILEEMRPDGALRPSIRELADQGGAYIIVSTGTSLTDIKYKNRINAMKEAVDDIPNKDNLTLDFIDRDRLATWVRDHAGLTLWVKRKIGQAVLGWQPYGAWSYDPNGTENEYLTDKQVRIENTKTKETGMDAISGITAIRNTLRQPKSSVRLVGLSGVGKTRLVQALFDSRAGENGDSLNPTLAYYTDINSGPNPQPESLASDLVATGTRAILVVDNCSPDLHRRLTNICRSNASFVSVITVEYDIRDDEPEGTDVYVLKPSSGELIEQLIRRRYPQISGVDIQTISEFSGGNARIAIALAETVGKNETLSGLGDTDLFLRLFHQKNTEDDSLFLIAQACALFSSFQGEEISYCEEA